MTLDIKPNINAVKDVWTEQVDLTQNKQDGTAMFGCFQKTFQSVLFTLLISVISFQLKQPSFHITL